MTARIIRGLDIAATIREEIAAEAKAFASETGIVPGLLTIIVGNDPPSLSYVTAKQKTAKELGFFSIQENLPETVSEKDLLGLIDTYNHDRRIHAILVQLPLPAHIDETKILYAIDPSKDVDGFHPLNLGKLVLGEETFYPCTPNGIRELLVRSGVETGGADVVIVGRSNIVGKPLAIMLGQKGKGGNATVTVCHTATRNLADHTTRADILVVAAGVPRAVTADMVKENAVVIDVGVNRTGVTAEGKAKLCGDVDFESVKEKASMITPVPGGVGPMTITMLMVNTLKAARFAARDAG